jgi:hypothetical protein
MRCNAAIATAILLMAAAQRPCAADSYSVSIDPSIRTEPATGRLILFFITRTGHPGTWTADPIDAPFFSDPQPIASIAVKDLKPGEVATIDGSVFAALTPLDQFAGPIRVQAVLDMDTTERSHEQGPGNLYSDEVKAIVSATAEERVELKLTHIIQPHEWPQDTDTVKWMKLRSTLLSDFYGRDVYHLAGVALPPEYNDPNATRKQWPAVYVIPGYGGRFDDRHDGGADYAHMLASPGVADVAPYGVHIVLDPESPLGHHGFVDSPNHGPRGTALVTELIPHLEKEFRLVAKPEARLLTGHSSGAWSSLWLQLNHPNVFGGCWASAPDPVDFSAFQMADIYNDVSMYADAHGDTTPSYRRLKNSKGETVVLMTVRQEGQMEHGIDPQGGSGQQWDAWEAMFSPRDEKTGMPRPLFDGVTGAIDQSVAQQWSKFDIARLVADHWDRYGPVMVNNVHLACGEWDSYFLNRAVERLKEKIDALRGDATGDGYIVLIPNATHETLPRAIGPRFNTEMREHFIKHGLQDE